AHLARGCPGRGEIVDEACAVRRVRVEIDGGPFHDLRGGSVAVDLRHRGITVDDAAAAGAKYSREVPLEEAAVPLLRQLRLPCPPRESLGHLVEGLPELAYLAGAAGLADAAAEIPRGELARHGNHATERAQEQPLGAEPDHGQHDAD